jgi:hypothetical protein
MRGSKQFKLYLKFGIFLINTQLPRKLFKSLGLLPSQLAYGRFSVCLFLMRKHEAISVTSVEQLNLAESSGE